MNRRLFLSASALGIPALVLAGCNTPAATIISDAQAVATDAASILALGVVPQPFAGIATLVLTGFQALQGAVSGSIAAGASTEATVIASLMSSVKSLQASVPSGSAVYNDAAVAVTALKGLSADSSETAQAQAEAAVGTALVAYLQLSMPETVSMGVHASAVTGLLSNARMHLAKMKA
jgi:hypothetical protein